MLLKLAITSSQYSAAQLTTEFGLVVKASVMQVGCPEARIDENVAKLTAAGYKASLLEPCMRSIPHCKHVLTAKPTFTFSTRQTH